MRIYSLNFAWFYTYLTFLSHVWVNRTDDNSNWALSLGLGVENHPRTSCVFLLALVKFILSFNTWLWGPYSLPTLFSPTPKLSQLVFIGVVVGCRKILFGQHITRWWSKESLAMGIPRRLTGKESACQCRRRGLDYWPGKIVHATGQLSPCATTIRPVL